MTDPLTKEELQKTIGMNIRKYRKRRGLTLKEVANKGGFSESYMSLIEVGKNTPNLYKVYLVAHYLNIPFYAIMDEEKEIDTDLNDPIFQEEGFKKYLNMAKTLYLKGISFDKLENAIDILTYKPLD